MGLFFYSKFEPVPAVATFLLPRVSANHYVFNHFTTLQPVMSICRRFRFVLLDRCRVAAFYSSIIPFTYRGVGTQDGHVPLLSSSYFQTRNCDTFLSSYTCLIPRAAPFVNSKVTTDLSTKQTTWSNQ